MEKFTMKQKIEDQKGQIEKDSFDENVRKSENKKGSNFEFLEKSIEYGLKLVQKKAIYELKKIESISAETGEKKSLRQFVEEKNLIRKEISEMEKEEVDFNDSNSIEDYINRLAKKFAELENLDKLMWEKETGQKLPTREELEKYEEKIKNAIKRKAEAYKKTTTEILKELKLSKRIDLDRLPSKSLEEIHNLIENPEADLGKFTEMRMDIDRLKETSSEYNDEYNTTLIDFKKNLMEIKESFKNNEIDEQEYKEKMKEIEERKEVLKLLPKAEDPEKIEEFFTSLEIAVNQKAKEISAEIKTNVKPDDIWEMLNDTFQMDRFLLKGQVGKVVINKFLPQKQESEIARYYREELNNIIYDENGNLTFKEKPLSEKEKQEYCQTVDEATDEFLIDYSAKSDKYDENEARKIFEDMSDVFEKAQKEFVNNLSDRQKNEQYWYPVFPELDKMEEELKNKLEKLPSYSDKRFDELKNGLPVIAEKKDLEGMKALLEKIGIEEFSKADLKDDELEEKLKLARVAVQRNQLKESLNNDIQEVKESDLAGIKTKREILDILEDAQAFPKDEFSSRGSTQEIVKKLGKYGSVAIAALVVAAPVIGKELLKYIKGDSEQKLSDENITEALQFQENNPVLWKAINERYFKGVEEDTGIPTWGFNNSNITLFFAKNPKIMKALNTEEYAEIKQALINKEKSVNIFALANALNSNNYETIDDIIFRVNLTALEKKRYEKIQEKIQGLEEGQKEIIKEQKTSEVNITEQVKERGAEIAEQISKEHKEIKDIGFTNLRRTNKAIEKLNTLLSNSELINENVKEILNNGTKIDQKNQEAIEGALLNFNEANEKLDLLSKQILNNEIAINDALSTLDDISKQVNDIGKETHQIALDANATKEIVGPMKDKVDDIYDLLLDKVDIIEPKDDNKNETKIVQTAINVSELSEAGKSFYDKYKVPDDNELLDILKNANLEKYSVINDEKVYKETNLTSSELTWLLSNRMLEVDQLTSIINGGQEIYQNMSPDNLYLFTKQVENLSYGITVNSLYESVLDHPRFEYDNHAVIEVIVNDPKSQNDVLLKIAKESNVPVEYLNSIAKHPNFYSFDKWFALNSVIPEETLKYIVDNRNLAYLDISGFVKSYNGFLSENPDSFDKLVSDNDFFNEKYPTIKTIRDIYNNLPASSKENFVQQIIENDKVDYLGDESKNKILNDPDISDELKDEIKSKM